MATKPDPAPKAPAAPSPEPQASSPESQLAPVPPQIAAPAASESKPPASLRRNPPVTPLSERITRGGSLSRPGDVLAQRRADARPERKVPFLSGPSDQEVNMRRRVDRVRSLLARTVKAVDADMRLAKELLHEIKTLQGGDEAAEKEGFDLTRAAALATELDAVVDKFSAA